MVLMMLCTARIFLPYSFYIKYIPRKFQYILVHFGIGFSNLSFWNLTEKLCVICKSIYLSEYLFQFYFTGESWEQINLTIKSSYIHSYIFILLKSI